jgi:hypothetical protein
MYQPWGNQKQAGVSTLISDKAYLKQKSVRRDKEDHYKLIKGTIPQENIIVLKLYAPNVRCSQVHKTNIIKHKRIGRSRK